MIFRKGMILKEGIEMNFEEGIEINLEEGVEINFKEGIEINFKEGGLKRFYPWILTRCAPKAVCGFHIGFLFRSIFLIICYVLGGAKASY